MTQAATIGKEWLARVAVVLVLSDRVLDVLTRERVLELGGEDRDAVEEEHQVEALLTLLAVAELAHHREEVKTAEKLIRCKSVSYVRELAGLGRQLTISGNG
jgi:hypothetical protein